MTPRKHPRVQLLVHGFKLRTPTSIQVSSGVWNQTRRPATSPEGVKPWLIDALRSDPMT